MTDLELELIELNRTSPIRPYVAPDWIKTTGAPLPKKPTPKPAGKADADGPTLVQLIAQYWARIYRPDYRRGNAIHTHTGEMISKAAACDSPTSELRDLLATATDAPQFKGGGVDIDKIPFAFRKWAPFAWGDMLATVPEEFDAKLGSDSTAAEEFKRMVSDVLLAEVVLGDVIANSTVTQTERRSLIDWCVKFAKPGPWRSIRSKRCWCKTIDLTGGEYLLRVALRVELFGQMRGDKRLCQMTQNTFGKLAERYGIGSSHTDDRPHGQRAVVLDDRFVESLTDSLCDPDTDPENLTHPTEESRAD